jgi:Cu+-exporting ATPase
MIQNLPVAGMTCAACVTRVEKNLKKMTGVTNATVNLATESVRIDFDVNTISIESIAEQLYETGYELIIKKEPDNVDDRLLEREIDIRRDFLISLICTLPVFSLSMGLMLSPVSEIFPVSMNMLNFIFCFLSLLVLIIPGRRFLVPAWKLAMHGASDMNTLVSLGTSIAWLYSTYELIWGEHSGHSQHLYFDSTTTIITLVLLGKMLETKAKRKAGNALQSLLNVQSTKALKKTSEGSFIECNASDIVIGDILMIRPGESFPVDGMIISGDTSCDESMLTGESHPIIKKIGDSVIGGAINIDSSIEIKAIAIGSDTVLSKIAAIVKEAQGSKAAIQSLADKISSVFVPAVLITSFITFIIYFAFLHASFNDSILPTIAILLIACPCALGLATPTAITVAIGTGAKHGIIIRNADALEKAGNIDIVAFDKTGTLTIGKPHLQSILIVNPDYNRDILISYASTIEQYSLHPFAQAIIKECQEIMHADSVQEIPGKGMIGITQGHRIHIGNLSWLSDQGISFAERQNQDIKQEHSILGMSIDNIAAGLFIFADVIRDESIDIITKLHQSGIRTIMLSGDHPETAMAIAKKIGILEVIAGILPHQKLERIDEFQKQGHRIAMIGDGINDAPALAKAHLGIAMGSGTDIAKNTADITIMNTDLYAVLKAIRLSKNTMRIIKQNFFWAFIFNIIGIPLAASGNLSPTFAAAAMACSSVSVISNSLRLKKL